MLFNKMLRDIVAGKRLGDVTKGKVHNAQTKSHHSSDATHAGRGQLVEAPFSSIQSLADFNTGIINFMTGKGLAGLSFTLTTDFGTFNLGIGGTSNNPLGFLSSPGFGNIFNASFSGNPLQTTFSPPNSMKGVTSSGPSGGKNK